MNTKPVRKLHDVIDQMIAALGDEKPTAIVSLLKVQNDCGFTAPEAQQRHWESVSEILDEEIVGDTPHDDFSDVQKAVIRIFTDNPTIV